MLQQQLHNQSILLYFFERKTQHHWHTNLFGSSYQHLVKINQVMIIFWLFLRKSSPLFCMPLTVFRFFSFINTGILLLSTCGLSIFNFTSSFLWVCKYEHKFKHRSTFRCPEFRLNTDSNLYFLKSFNFKVLIRHFNVCHFFWGVGLFNLSIVWTINNCGPSVYNYYYFAFLNE